LHRLLPRIAEARLADLCATDRLAQSIERCGQIIPCIAVPDDPERRLGSWILIDGYRRVAALKSLGLYRAQVWRCDLSEGLRSLAYALARRLDLLEGALLVRELVEGFGLTQLDVARRRGWDVSWVPAPRVADGLAASDS
jgi:ParB-like chromosome segregation protein Spo0J